MLTTSIDMSDHLINVNSCHYIHIIDVKLDDDDDDDDDNAGLEKSMEIMFLLKWWKQDFKCLKS